MAERELEQDLALARQALRGPEAMKARVRLRLAEARRPPQADASPQTPAPGARLLRVLRHRPGLGTLIVLLGVSFGTGFWLGRQPSASEADALGVATLRSLPREAAPALPLATAREPKAAVPESSATGTDDKRRARDPAARPSLAGGPAPVALPRAAEPQRARAAARPRVGMRESSWRASSEGQGTDDALAAEVALLERTERAIRKGHTVLALALLAELDEAFPSAALPEERQAARVLATCASDTRQPAEAASLAERFLGESPTSVYAERIREACLPRPAATIERTRLKEPAPRGH